MTCRFSRLPVADSTAHTLDPRLLVSLLLGMFWLLGAGVTWAQPSSPSIKTVSDTVALDPSGTVEIDNHRGSITVTTWDRAQVGYDVLIEPANDGDDLPFTSLATTRSEDELELDPDFPWRFHIPGVITISPGGTERATFHYTVAMPKSASLQIDDYASTIEISGIEGSVEIDTYSGGVTGTNLSGGLDLEGHSGDAQVTLTRLTAPLSIDTFSGSVRLTLPEDAGFDLETDLTRADQLTASGTLSLPSPTKGNYEGTVNGGGPLLSIQTHSGTVELRTP